jgi:organic hydroperoxide reductase OsmC/OhrA
MSEHVAEVVWERGDAPFLDQRYSRRHELRFDGGAQWAGSSSPQVVPVPMSDPSAVDPEEAFVASISSCHMLWFLSIAAKHGFVVDHYRDRAVGLMGKDAHGRLAITRVTLRPDVRFAGTQEPDEVEVAAMHHEAHESCFIANSVKTEVRCEPEG